MTTTWTLDDARRTLILTSTSGGLPRIVYREPRLLDPADGVAAAAVRDVRGGMLDIHPDISVRPKESRSFPGRPGLFARDRDGARLLPAFALTSADGIEGGWRFEARDASRGLTYEAAIILDAETGIVAARATLSSATAIRLDWLAAAVFPAPISPMR